MTTPTPLNIRFSETQMFKECRRKWFNSYYLGLEPRPAAPAPEGGEHVPQAPRSKPLEVGTVVDRALREFYFADCDVRETVAYLKASNPDAAHPEWHDIYDLADRMVSGYMEWLAEEGVDAGEQTVGTEVELHVPVNDGANLTVHIDRVLIDMWGNWVIEDTKTVDTLAKDATFQIDDQLLTYCWAWNRAFPDLPRITRARHNMLRRVKRAASAKPPFYARTELEFNDWQMDNHAMHLDGVLTDLLDVRRNLDAGADHHSFCYPRPSRDCSWKCSTPGPAVCVAHDDGSDLDGLRAELFQVRADYVPVPTPARKGAACVI